MSGHVGCKNQNLRHFRDARLARSFVLFTGFFLRVHSIHAPTADTVSTVAPAGTASGTTSTSTTTPDWVWLKKQSQLKLHIAKEELQVKLLERELAKEMLKHELFKAKLAKMENTKNSVETKQAVQDSKVDEAKQTFASEEKHANAMLALLEKPGATGASEGQLSIGSEEPSASLQEATPTLGSSSEDMPQEALGVVEQKLKDMLTGVRALIINFLKTKAPGMLSKIDTVTGLKIGKTRAAQAPVAKGSNSSLSQNIQATESSSPKQAAADSGQASKDTPSKAAPTIAPKQAAADSDHASKDAASEVQ